MVGQIAANGSESQGLTRERGRKGARRGGQTDQEECCYVEIEFYSHIQIEMPQK